MAMTDRFSFDDVSLGMSFSDFSKLHPAPTREKYGPPASPKAGEADCVGTTNGDAALAKKHLSEGIEECGYFKSIDGVPLRIGVKFLDGHLALISISSPGDDEDCFSLSPPAGCRQYSQLWRRLTANEGSVNQIAPKNENLKGVNVERWENATSIAQFEGEMCGPWNGEDSGWSKEISELLAGEYCGPNDELSAREAAMFYLDKALSPTLAKRLSE